MNLKFTSLYTQALGATLGVIACVYSYLNGFIITYGNIHNFFDTLSFLEIFASYTLLPLCAITLILSFIKINSKDYKILNVPLSKINTSIAILTVLVGFIGSKIYFLIPAIFILLNLFINNIKIAPSADSDEYNIDEIDNKIEKLNTVKEDCKVTENTIILNREYDDNEDKNTISTNLDNKTNSILDEHAIKLLKAKEDMAIDLILKNADKDFILDVTGLTKEQLDNIINKK